MLCHRTNLFSDHFINGTVRYYTLISLLFTCMLSHGVAPSGLLLSTKVPVPKDKRGNKNNSSNYRAIAVSSILGKLLDSIIIQDQHVSLKTDDLQFGFKENTSTIPCTQLLIETVECYNSNNILIVLWYYGMPPKRLTELNMSVYLNFYGTEICG